MSDRERLSVKYKGWGILVGACPVIAAIVGRRMRYDPSSQDFLASAPGICLLVLLWLGFAIGVHGWTRGHRERQIFLASAAAGAGLIMVVVALGNVYGWMGGMVTRPPLFIQLLVYGLHVFAMVHLPGARSSTDMIRRSCAPGNLEAWVLCMRWRKGVRLISLV
jgi:hypothetical protein